MDLTKQKQGLLLFVTQFFWATEANRKSGNSFALLAVSERVAYTLTDTIGCNRRLPVPDRAEQYCDSQLPSGREEKEGMLQDRSCEGGVAVRGTYHNATSVRLSHG